MIKRPITTNQFPPLELHKARPRKSINTNKVQPLRPEIPAKRRAGFEHVITSNDVQPRRPGDMRRDTFNALIEVVDDFGRKHEAEKPKKGRPKGK